MRRLNKFWLRATLEKLHAGVRVRMTADTRKLFLLKYHDAGLDLKWKFLGTDVWEARPKIVDEG
jgi:hypothetical protein